MHKLMTKFLRILLILDLVIVNLGVGYLIFKIQDSGFNSQITNKKNEVNVNPVLFPPTEVKTDVCGPDCRKYIDDKVGSIAAGMVITPVPTVKPVVITKIVPKIKTRTVSYVTIPGSGSSSRNDWQDIPGTDVYFDTADYAGLVEVYLEASVKLFNGNGMAYVRLFDVTHGIGVQGSEISTNNQADIPLTSGQVTFWSGKNLIRVQAKSLTADTAIFSYGRLKVITEN